MQTMRGVLHLQSPKPVAVGRLCLPASLMSERKEIMLDFCKRMAAVLAIYR